MGGPLVSVVIPCYNQGRFLGEAIESVLAQSYPRYEIIVVDDGSTDETAEVATRYEAVRLIRQENRGLSGARNTGIEHSEGEYVVFLDADDRLLPEALEVGVRELEARPECAFVSGYCKLIAANGSPGGEWRHHPADEDRYLALLQKCYIPAHSAVMYRRRVFDHVGGFDTSLEACEDYDHYLRVARRLPVYHHGDAMVECRRHDANMTKKSALMLRETLKVLHSQREYVQNDTRRAKAYKLGVRYEQAHWGNPLVDGLRAHIRRREWDQALEAMLVLLRYYPRGLVLLNERRMERHKLAQRLQARKEQLRAHRWRLRTVGITLPEDRQKTRSLRREIQALKRREKEMDPQEGRWITSTLHKLFKKAARVRATVQPRIPR